MITQKSQLFFMLLNHFIIFVMEVPFGQRSKEMSSMSSVSTWHIFKLSSMKLYSLLQNCRQSNRKQQFFAAACWHNLALFSRENVSEAFHRIFLITLLKSTSQWFESDRAFHYFHKLLTLWLKQALFIYMKPSAVFCLYKKG